MVETELQARKYQRNPLQKEAFSLSLQACVLLKQSITVHSLKSFVLMELTVHTTSGFFFYLNIKVFLAADSNLITLPEIKLTFFPFLSQNFQKGNTSSCCFLCSWSLMAALCWSSWALLRRLPDWYLLFNFHRM